MRLGVLIPARNEARVLGRRLANLAAARWPDGGPHRIVVVDDGSTDGTAAVAESEARARFAGRADVVCSVRGNDGAPGKPGAVARGLRALDEDGGCDLVVLTDADVVVHPDALSCLAAAFGRADVAMACGAQVFVRALDDGGAFAGPAGSALERADGWYDRVTALVRRLESRGGRLFSVHGQLLAWRASLGLRPVPGRAADDLDLALAVRARLEPPRRIEIVPGARFAEEKQRGEAGDGQALRRARAYFQTVCDVARPRLPGALDRLQLALYRHGPPLAPALAAVGAVGLPLAAGLAFGRIAALGAAAAVVLLAGSPPGRRLARLLVVIARARLLERRADLGDRWEMVRR